MSRAENYYDNILKEAPIQVGQIVSDYPVYRDITSSQKQIQKGVQLELIIVPLVIILCCLFAKKFIKINKKNMNTNKIFITTTLLLYTFLNLYIIGKIISQEYWWLYFRVEKGGMVAVAMVLGLFLNAALIIYCVRRN